MEVDGLLPRESQNDEDEYLENSTHMRAPNKSQFFEQKETEFIIKNFYKNALHDESDFERRFQKPCAVFDRLLSGLNARDPFVCRQDALQKEGISIILRFNSSLRIPAYTKFLDEVDEICEIQETSARASFKSFIRKVIAVFAGEHVRARNEVDFCQILGIKSQRRSLGCVDIWDYQRWEWKNLLVEWGGKFNGK